MNEKVMKKLARITKLVEEIKSDANYVKKSIKEIKESDDLYVIESTLESIERQTKEARIVCLNTYDDFEEDES